MVNGELIAFLLDRKEEITASWLETIRSSQKVRPGNILNRPRILEELRRVTAGVFQSMRDSLQGKSAATAFGRDYGYNRWREQYQLDELVFEIDSLRVEVLGKYVSAFYQARPLPEAEVEARLAIGNFFTEFLHHAITKYITEYQRESEGYITQLEELNRLLHASLREFDEVNQARIRMLQTVAHDLRNFLNSVILAVRFLERTEDETRRLAFIGMLKNSVNTMSHLLNQLLSYAKVLSGMETAEVESFDLAQLIHEQARNFSLQAAEKGLGLQVVIEEEPLEIMSDQGKVIQILGNLINNAIKYTRRGGIRIDLKTEGDNAVFTVTDTGSGISAEYLPFIFEEFARLPGTEEKGTGLGLAITKRLVEILRGEIKVSSVVGRGSAFMVMLPKI